MRRKYKEYYYTTKVAETASRNNGFPIKLYNWFIKNNEGEVLQQSEQLIEGKEMSEIDCEEHIDEYYY